jgi:hypothetical protein
VSETENNRRMPLCLSGLPIFYICLDSSVLILQVFFLFARKNLAGRSLSNFETDNVTSVHAVQATSFKLLESEGCVSLLVGLAKESDAIANGSEWPRESIENEDTTRFDQICLI